MVNKIAKYNDLDSDLSFYQPLMTDYSVDESTDKEYPAAS